MGLAAYMKDKGISFEGSLSAVKHDPHLRELYFQENLVLTKKRMKNVVSDDVLVIQAINMLGELEKAFNLLVKRLREWYEWHCPEISKNVTSHDRFVKLLCEKSRAEMLNDFSMKETMGAELKKEDVEAMIALASALKEMIALREREEAYLGNAIKKILPNTTEILGPSIAAKLLAHAGSIEKLAKFPASTIQLLGAEKALFRHLKTGARSPKYGVIFQHPYFSKVERKLQGKLARTLADKLTIAIKVDYYKGEKCAERLKQQIEKRFGL